MSPTIYYNVPRGFSALVPFLEAEDALAATFFARLRVIVYAGAALTPELWDAARRPRAPHGRAPRADGVGMGLDRDGADGDASPTSSRITRATSACPCPASRSSSCLLAPSSSSGCGARTSRPATSTSRSCTEAAFDDEGFYCIGDAGLPVDPDDPCAGITFDGRLAEDFKLSSGTWVSVASVRTGVVSAAAPVVADAVVSGPGRDELCVLAWVDPSAASRILSCRGALADLNADERVRSFVADAITRYNQDRPGSSERVARVLLLDHPPSIDANEITDKGYINQGAVLAHRAGLVDRVHAGRPARDVLVL